MIALRATQRTSANMQILFLLHSSASSNQYYVTEVSLYICTGGTLNEKQIQELQRLTASATEINERRAAFIQIFLES